MENYGRSRWLGICADTAPCKKLRQVGLPITSAPRSEAVDRYLSGLNKPCSDGSGVGAGHFANAVKKSDTLDLDRHFAGHARGYRAVHPRLRERQSAYRTAGDVDGRAIAGR